MPPIIALLVFLAFWLLGDYLIRRDSSDTSPALIVPLLWIVIAGSRPITTWFDHAAINSTDALLEGSPADRLLYLTLICLSLIILIRRGISFSEVARGNILLTLYFAFLLVGSVWSDYPSIALKRWGKDIGNLVVILVIATEKDPIAAAKTVLLRAACLLIPASVLLIKYFPEYSRYFDGYTGRGYYSGVALDKNLLGMSIAALLAVLFWAIFDDPLSKRSRVNALTRVLCGVLFILGIWLLRLADCATAIASTVAGIGIHMLLRFRFVRAHFIGLALTMATVAVVAYTSGLLAYLGEIATAVLQRDASLTGRDEIWRIVLSENINPLFGAGSYTFWMPERMERMSQGYESPFNSAHNGFIDIYLNVGLIGAGLLVCVLVGGIFRMMRAIDHGAQRWSFQVGAVFLMVCAIYAGSEAVFNRLNLLWIGMLIFLACIPRRRTLGRETTIEVTGAQPS